MRPHPWDVAPTGDWRPYARRVMERIVTQAQADGLSAAETLKLIDAAYPWPPRAHHPYQIWLDERKRIRVRLGLLDDPRGDRDRLTRVGRIARGQTEMELVV